MIKPKQDIIVGGKSLGPIVPFNFNPPQQAVWNLMVEMIMAGKGIKLIILKRTDSLVSAHFSAPGCFGLCGARPMSRLA